MPAHGAAAGFVVAFSLLFVSACSDDPSTLQPFSSDGCSLFPDRSLISSADWCTCCLEHDAAYWRGGTQAQREAADLALRECIVAQTGNEALAGVMYEGVRFGGSPYFYNWYRWGYGWDYDRRYQVLSPAEMQLADGLLESWRAGNQGDTCPVDQTANAERGAVFEQRN